MHFKHVSFCDGVLSIESEGGCKGQERVETYQVVGRKEGQDSVEMYGGGKRAGQC